MSDHSPAGVALAGYGHLNGPYILKVSLESNSLMIRRERVIYGDGAPLRLVPRAEGGLKIQCGKRFLSLSRDELHDLAAAIVDHLEELNRPRIQRYVAGVEQFTTT